MTTPNGAAEGAARAWFRRQKAVPHPRLRLFCFPHGGGAASFYRSWPGLFPPDVEVLAARYPGREDRLNEASIDRMEPLADAVAEAMVPYLSEPFAFFGHSLGASVAHEVAVRLERRHQAVPTLLLVSSRPAPHRLHPGVLHTLGDEALLADVRHLDRRGSAALDDPDLRMLAMPAIRADYHLVGTYRPGLVEPVSAPISGYAADADPVVTVDEVRAWQEVSTAGFDLRVFSGDHFYLVPHARELIADIIGKLNRPAPAVARADPR